MKAVERYFFGPVAAARPWLLMKLFLTVLAFDCWIDLTPHGGRYGIGDFNVAHFAWLDALVPTPTPAIYVGLICCAGLLAMINAIGGVNRAALAALAAVYTYAWTMSMLDSYQHHYLLSIVLLVFIFYPAVSARLVAARGGPGADAEGPDASEAPNDGTSGGGKKSRKGRGSRGGGRAERRAAERAAAKERRDRGAAKKLSLADSGGLADLPGGSLSAWAYHATAVSFGIVYCYTAVSKSEPQWRDGSALQRIAPEGMAPFYDYFVDGLGWEHDTFWSLAGTSVIAVQVLIAAAYFAAPLLDRGLRWAQGLCFAGYLGATSFHIGAEHLGLEIGWFSYYMLIAAAVFLLPGSLVGAVGRFFARAAAATHGALADAKTDSAVPLALGAAVLAGMAGYAVDMPGAMGGSIAAGVILLAVVGRMMLRTDGGAPGPDLLPFVMGTVLAALAMWVAFVGTEARYDYYRFVGGDHRRRGEHQEALDAYIKANDYAPADDNRYEKEDEMRGILGLPPRWSGQ